MAISNDPQVTINWQKHNRGNGLGPRTVILKVEKAAMTYDDLNEIAFYLTQASGLAGDLIDDQADAFTIAGLTSDQADGEFVEGVSGEVILALQGTGVVNASWLVSETVATAAEVLAEFDQRVIPA